MTSGPSLIYIYIYIRNCYLYVFRLLQIVQRSGVLVTERKKSEFSDKDVVQDLGRLVQGWQDANVAGKPVMEHTHAVLALNALIRYLEVGYCYAFFL